MERHRLDSILLKPIKAMINIDYTQTINEAEVINRLSDLDLLLQIEAQEF